MTLGFALTLFLLGASGAFVAGLLGVGGAIVMIPLLLYVPPLVGAGTLDMKSVAGITMVQARRRAWSWFVWNRWSCRSSPRRSASRVGTWWDLLAR